MTIYSYTRLDGKRVVIDTGVAPLLVDVTNWFETQRPVEETGALFAASEADIDQKQAEEDK